ncbi:hypothetical protein HZ994_07470 [Akkermansiaceae bacterium]|nr:hypothetical protein HZ994_07470 [Akkermansiaceae bacterium]
MASAKPRHLRPTVTRLHKRTAAFARGFFTYLEGEGVRSAVLHGGENGFEEELSDVDFAVSDIDFLRLPALIQAYCAGRGWRLCQILRHETTASFFVCSAIDDPACAVALDACSDYQRNGTLFMEAEELLAGRERLGWGGYRLATATELRYRFAKAAAKGKDTIACAAEFARYPEECRAQCEMWLRDEWGHALTSWDPAGVNAALTAFHSQCNARPSIFSKAGIKRIFARILEPTGLVVIAGTDQYGMTATRLEEVFGHLYFRRCIRAPRWRILLFKDLVCTSMIILPEIGKMGTHLIPARCLHRVDPIQESSVQEQALAAFLHDRLTLS